MAKTDLLKEAIADAKAVKETAIANAKIALEEAFGSRLESMLGEKLAEQIDDEEELDMDDMYMDAEMGMEPEMADDELGTATPDAVRVGVDLNMDGQYDIEGELGAGEAEMDMDMDAEIGMEPEMGDEPKMGDEPEMGDEEMDSELDMELEEIIRELEEGSYKEDDPESEGMKYEADNIDSMIESILAEEEAKLSNEGSYGMKKELDEAYSVIEQLRYTINEVNLLNAKLLYTNKLFRNFELNDTQKMKVIENFDRAASTREVKLVFSTLSESFKKPVNKKRIVKESKSYASRPTASTAPSREIISESAEFANRWKKLAGLI